MAVTTTHAGWSRELACDLFPGSATPFAWTLLRGPAETALRRVLTELGAPAMPTHALWQRQADGRVYVAAGPLAEAGAATHGAAWLGPERPVVATGPLARLSAAGAIRRAQGRVSAAADEVNAGHARLAQWLTWVRQLPWTQADVLHVMEELEPRATAALHSYLTLRAGLAAAYAELWERLERPERWHGALFAGLTGLPTVEAAYTLATAAQDTPTSLARQEALARYGHRGPGELRPDAARWLDQPELLNLLPQRRAAETQAHADGRGRSVAEALRRARDLTRAADLAWDGLVIVMAVAQRWAQVTAHEALAAQLIFRPADALFLELEELKQIATGEWHRGDADQVQAEVAQRRIALEAIMTPAPAVDRPAPVSHGQAQGPTYLAAPPANLPPPGAIWLAESADPGCAPLWLAAGGVISAAADPCAPGLIAARVLGLPAVAGAATLVAQARPGQQITLDGGTGRVAVV